MQERKGIATFGSKPVTLVGPEIKVGDKAPEFRLIDPNLKEVALSNAAGKVRLIASVVSLDTGTCDLETQRFNSEAAKFEGVQMYTISVDLPFAQRRFCEARDVRNLVTLSDHRDVSFGTAYGVLMKELRLLLRAVFIVDGKGIVRYVEYLREAGNPPDYDRALATLKDLVTKAKHA